MSLFKKRLTEQEAALRFIRCTLEETERAWPIVQKDLKDLFEEKFVIVDETMAIFDTFLAVIAQDLQAVKNLFPMEQADRIEKWVLKCLGQTKDWGQYAVDEVKKYGAAFEEEMQVDIPLGAIPARLVHRWLGESIRHFEAEIGGEKTGLIDALLMMKMTMVLVRFSGFWKNIKVTFKLVEGDVPLDEESDGIKGEQSL